MERDDIYCINCGTSGIENFAFDCARANFDYYTCKHCGEQVTISNDGEEDE